MLKKILRDFLILFGLFILWASTSRTAMQFVSEWRDGEAWWCTYPFKHGDLIGLSYLDFAFYHAPYSTEWLVRRAPNTLTGRKQLFLFGDSNTKLLRDTMFSEISGYQYLVRHKENAYQLDTAKRNILLIEIGERMVRNYFRDTTIFSELHPSPPPTAAIAPPAAIRLCSSVPQLSVDMFFNKLINQNLQCNLFNYNFIMPLFQSKAALNYYLFTRASGDVVISNDKKYLLLKETVTPNEPTSSYSPLPDEEIDQIVHNINIIYHHYLQQGFSHVYLSIIPNTSTIVQPRGYNLLIPRLQQHPLLEMPHIDIYTTFTKATDRIYAPGDTHWNIKGKQLWVDEVNKVLVSLPK